MREGNFLSSKTEKRMRMMTSNDFNEMISDDVNALYDEHALFPSSETVVHESNFCSIVACTPFVLIICETFLVVSLYLSVHCM